MPARDDLSLLTDAARAAGDIARKHFGNGPETWDKGDGQGPVTEADLEIDRMLFAQMRAAQPDYGWLSEETADNPERLSQHRVFIVDPIDGTRAFIKGEKTFSHALAVVENGVPVAAAVYLPLLDLMFTATKGGGAFLNNTPISPTDHPCLQDARLLGSKKMFAQELWGGPLPVTRHFRTSLAYRLALVAEGQFDGMLTLRPSWEWDIAAGDLIAREAGAYVTDQTGAALRFNNPTPQVNGVLAATPAVHADLLARRP